jgi:hypothetical protein
VNVPAPKRNAFRLDLSLVKEKTRLSITDKRAKAADAHWAQHCDDPIPIIKVFAQCYRDGWATPNHNSVRSGTVEDTIRVVGQVFTQLGSTDIRKDAFGEIYVCLTRKLWCYKKEDAPPSRVKPVAILIMIFILHQAYASNSSEDRKAITNLITTAFYLLLFPGEYTGTTSNDTPFRLEEVELHVHDCLLDTMTATPDDLATTTTVYLTSPRRKMELRVRSSRTASAVTPGMSCQSCRPSLPPSSPPQTFQIHTTHLLFPQQQACPGQI